MSPNALSSNQNSGASSLTPPTPNAIPFSLRTMEDDLAELKGTRPAAQNTPAKAMTLPSQPLPTPAPSAPAPVPPPAPKSTPSVSPLQITAVHTPRPAPTPTPGVVPSTPKIAPTPISAPARPSISQPTVKEERPRATQNIRPTPPSFVPQENPTPLTISPQPTLPIPSATHSAKPTLEELFGAPKSQSETPQLTIQFEPSFSSPVQTIPAPPKPVQPIATETPKVVPAPTPPAPKSFATLPRDPFTELGQRGTTSLPTASPFRFPRWIMGVGISALTLLLLGGGAWYWKQSVTPPANPEEEVALPPIPDTTAQETPATPSSEASPTAPLPFNLLQANDLGVSLTASPSAFRAALLDASQKIKNNTAIQQPVEFRVVDMNGAPIPFATWSAWMSIALPKGALATLDTPFSLFLYNDQGYMRIGLKVTSKNPSQTKTLLAKNESTLLKGLVSLYLGPAPTLPKTPVKFATGNYHDITTRYFNFAVPEAPFVDGLSLDYASINQFLVFGTSKQTTRAILDTISPTTNR